MSRMKPYEERQEYSEIRYSGIRLGIRTPESDMPNCLYYPDVRIERALRKTSQARITDTKTKVDFFTATKHL